MDQIDFYFGLGSRYSYLAFTQISRIETAHACKFVLHPISSVELLSMREKSPFTGNPISGQYEREYRRKDAEAWSRFYQVPYIEPKPLPSDHQLMARACYAADVQGALRSFCKAMFNAVFVENEQIDADRCAAIGSRLGINERDLVQTIESPAISARATNAAHIALRRGAFGVPTFFIGDKMFWGNDRLVLLEHYLASLTR